MDSSTARRRSFREDLRRVKPRWVILAVLVTFAGSHLVSQIHFDSGDYDDVSYKDRSHEDRSWVKTAPPDWKARQSHNRQAISNLTTGMPRSEALATLGNPDFEEQYGHSVDVVFYRTSSDRQDGKTDKRTETTPVVFSDDLLITHGRYQPSSPERRVTDANWESAQYERASRIGALEQGAELNSVLDQVGTPTFHDRIGDRVNILFYRTHRDEDDGRTSKLRETTPLVFIDGKLAAKDFRLPQ